MSRARPKCQVTIGSIDDVCDLVDSLTPFKGIFVGEPTFNNVREWDA